DFSRGRLAVTGEYRELLRPDASGPAVASIVESYAGRLESAFEFAEPNPRCYEELDESATFEDYLFWLEECFEAMMAASLPTAMDMEGFHQLLLVEGDFPWGGSSRLVGELIFPNRQAFDMTL